MKKYIMFFVILFVLIFGIKVFAAEIIWQDFSMGNLDLRTVNFLLFGPQDKNSLYAATGNGLFYSVDKGRTWKKIFSARDYLQRDCTTIAVVADTIYLGTKAGLFMSKDRGRSWHKETGILGKSHILAIAYQPKGPDHIYLACVEGVFKMNTQSKTREKIFIAYPVENGEDTEEPIQDQDEAERFSKIRYIAVDPQNLGYIYLATSKGIYESKDRGVRWQNLTDYGLLSRDVKFLLFSDKSELYAATKSAVFVYKCDRWQELSFGLMADEIRFLALDEQDNLYAGCDKGLFKASLKDFSQARQDNITRLYYQDEPDISAVQQQAIKYAEVELEKIKQWRNQAAKKAWLPEVDMGINKDAGDLWHWETGSTTRTDDDVLRRGRATMEWDLSLKWDLSELIFNDDQTSIDVRSRLMVQLRDDILDEVTRLYFERLRVKMELDNLSIEDRKKRLEKELRIEELTAMLDGLTGGYFSQQIKVTKEEKGLQEDRL